MELVSLLVSQCNLTSWDMPTGVVAFTTVLVRSAALTKQKGGLQATEIYFSQL